MLRFDMIRAEDVRVGDILLFGTGGFLVETITANGPTLLVFRGGGSSTVENYYDDVRVLRLDDEALSKLGRDIARAREVATSGGSGQ